MLITAPPLMPRFSLASSWSRVGKFWSWVAGLRPMPSSLSASSRRAKLERIPQLAEGLPSSLAALNGLPRAIRKEPLRRRVASPMGIGLSRGGSAPRSWTGDRTARSLRGSAAMISASNDWPPTALTLSRAAPRTTWKAVRISPWSPITTPEPKSKDMKSSWTCLGTGISNRLPSANRGDGFRPRTARVSCEPGFLSRWIATTDGSARAIASAITDSMEATMSAAAGPVDGRSVGGWGAC